MLFLYISISQAVERRLQKQRKCALRGLKGDGTMQSGRGLTPGRFGGASMFDEELPSHRRTLANLVMHGRLLKFNSLLRNK
jgi:hypothetical protein